MRTGLTQKVREAAQGFKGEFNSADLKAALDVRTYRECRTAVSQVVRDLRRAGEIETVSRGVYRYKGRKTDRTKLDVIWHLARSMWQFETDDIERLSGAKRSTALEYLHCLRRLGHVRQRRRGHWELLNDPGPQTPVNSAKCDRLRRLRKDRGQN